MLLDSYLSHPKVSNVPRTKLQLIGLACLLISSKIEEIRPPNLSDLRMICDNLYSKKEIAEMELEICRILQWNLTPMNLLNWIRYKHTNSDCTSKTDPLVIEKFLDYLIHFPDILNFKPSNLSSEIISLTSQNSSNSWLHNRYFDDKFSIIYCDPKEIDKLSDENFDLLIKEHRKTLNFIIKSIKLAENER